MVRSGKCRDKHSKACTQTATVETQQGSAGTRTHDHARTGRELPFARHLVQQAADWVLKLGGQQGQAAPMRHADDHGAGP